MPPRAFSVGPHQTPGRCRIGRGGEDRHNLILAICINANAEALVLGAKFGVDPEKLVDSVIDGVGFNHGMRKHYKQHVLRGDFGENGRCQAVWSRSAAFLRSSGRLIPTTPAGVGVDGGLRKRSGWAL